jgi:hypothetical protein
MAGHGPGQGHGRGHGDGQHGGLGAGSDRDQRDMPVGRTEDQEVNPNPPDGSEGGDDGSFGHGGSEESPGHLKRAAGEQSARDFAPGRARRS